MVDFWRINMAAFPLLAVGLVMKLVAVVFVICGIALILVVLIQKGKGGGLSSAFGGGMVSGLLGSKTGDFLTWFTIVLVGVFLALAVVMVRFYRPTVGGFGGRPAAGQEQPQGTEQPTSGGSQADSNASGG